MQAYDAVVFATKADEREREEPAFESDAKPSSGRSIEGLVALRYTQLHGKHVTTAHGRNPT